MSPLLLGGTPQELVLLMASGGAPRRVAMVPWRSKPGGIRDATQPSRVCGGKGSQAGVMCTGVARRGGDLDVLDWPSSSRATDASDTRSGEGRRWKSALGPRRS